MKICESKHNQKSHGCIETKILLKIAFSGISKHCCSEKIKCAVNSSLCAKLVPATSTFVKYSSFNPNPILGGYDVCTCFVS